MREGHAPPLAQDELEDWIRFPLDPEELTIRSDTLLGRAQGVAPRTSGLVLDADGVLRRGERWVALSPTEARVFAPLLDLSGTVVHRSRLVSTGWPMREPVNERAIDGVIKRLRRRIAPLGVSIHTVPGTGFLLDHYAGTA